MPILQTTEIFRRSKAVVVEAICCDFFPQILLAPVFKKELQIYSLKKKKNDASNDTKCEHHHLSWCPGNNHENHPQEPHHYPATPIHRRLRRNRQLLPLVQPTRKKNNVDLNQPLSREVPPIQAPKRRHGVYQGAYFLNEKRSKSEILGGISGFNEILFCQTPNLHETNWIDYMKDDILSYAKYGLPT